MSLSKRIIPCLDIKDSKTVKGINFENIKIVGDPVELGAYYAQQGADELVFLDVSATHEKKKIFLELVTRIAKQINIPFTVGGGISSIEDVFGLLNAGADKVSVNSAAVKNPYLLTTLANQYGRQCIVLAIDTKFESEDWYVYINGGRIPTKIKAKDWARRGVDMGAGEILLTSMDNDGTKNGFALEITRDISDKIGVPIIASGGAGNMSHFYDVFTKGNADAALAASIFHNKELEIKELKQNLKSKGVQIR